jgi:iron complex transport system substrate-binding protein
MTDAFSRFTGTILPRVGMVVLAVITGCKPTRPPSPAPTAAVRVVSLAPSITEMVCAVGAATQLVGRTTVCDFPPGAVAGVPVIGEFGAPSLERLLAARPGIVLYADMADPTLAAKLTRAGLRQARIPCTRLDEIPAALIAVGQFVHREEQARALAADLAGRIQRARETAVPAGHRPRVLMLIWNDPLTAVGRNSFLADLLALAGGQNLGESVDRDYFQVSSEWVLTRNPDVILCFFMTPGRSPRDLLAGQSGWGRVKAVQTGRVYDGFDNNLFLRPGPRVMEGMESLRRCLAEPPEADRDHAPPP